MIKTENYGSEKQILIAPELAFTISCTVTNTGIVADSDGKKIIRAGTPVGATNDVLVNRQELLMVKPSSSSAGFSFAGVVLHDTDVTEEDRPVALVVTGIIDLLKLDTATRGLITDDVKTALPRLIFMNGVE